MANLFVLQRRVAAPAAALPDAPDGNGGAGAAADGDNPGVFVTPKTLATLAVAVSTAKILSAVGLRLGFPRDLSDGVATTLVGVTLFLITIADPEAKPKETLGWTVALLVAAMNTAILYAAVVGIGALTVQEA